MQAKWWILPGYEVSEASPLPQERCQMLLVHAHTHRCASASSHCLLFGQHWTTRQLLEVMIPEHFSFPVADLCGTETFQNLGLKNGAACKLVLIFRIQVLFNFEMEAQGLKVWKTAFTLSTDINSLSEFSTSIWSLTFHFSMTFYTELTILLMPYYFPWWIPVWLNYNTDSSLQGALRMGLTGYFIYLAA